MQVIESDGTLTLALEPREEVPEAATLEAISAALGRVKAVRVESGDCQRIGTLALQSLIAIGQTADAAGASFVLGTPGDGFTAAAADLGLGPWMTAWRDDA